MTGGASALGLSLQSTNATTASSSVNNSTVNVSSGRPSKTIIIQKDEKGFGFKVTGSNPVEVASVTVGGAAERAGIRPGQKIVKVNGTRVFNCDHSLVVKTIKDAGSYVSLTVISPHEDGVFQDGASHDIAPHAPSATSGVLNLANASTNSTGNVYVNSNISAQQIRGLVNDASSSNPLVSALLPSIASLSHLSQQPSAQSYSVSSASLRSNRPLSPLTTGIVDSSTLSSTSSLLDQNSPSSSHGNSRVGLISGPSITSPLPAPESAQIECVKTREKTLKEYIRREKEHLSLQITNNDPPDQIEATRTRLTNLKRNLKLVRGKRSFMPRYIFNSPSGSNASACNFSVINQHMSSSTTQLLSPESMYGSTMGGPAGIASYDDIPRTGGIFDHSGGGIVNPAIVSSVSTAPQGPSLHSSFWSRGLHRDKYSSKESGSSNNRKSHSFKDELLREPKEPILSMESDDDADDDATGDADDEQHTVNNATGVPDSAPSEMLNANILNLAASTGKIKLSESKSNRSRKKSKEVLDDMDIRDVDLLVMTLLSHKNRIISSVSRSYASLGAGASASTVVSKNPKEKITGRRKGSSRASFMSSSISPEELEWLKEARKLMCLIAHSLNQMRSDINYLLFYALATLIQHELTTATSTASSSSSPFTGHLVKSEIKEALFELISIFLLTDSPLALTKLPAHLSSQTQLEVLTNCFSSNWSNDASPCPLHDLLTPYINFARDTVNEKLIKSFNQAKECGLLQSTLNMTFSGSSAKEKKKSARESMGRLLTDALNFEAQTPSDDVNFFPESDSLVSCLKLLIQGQPLKGDQTESIPYSHSMARVLSLLSTFYHFLPHSIFFALSSAIHCELEPFILLKSLITSNPASFACGSAAGHSTDSSAPRHKSLPSSLGSSISATFTGGGGGGGNSGGVITSPTGLPPPLSSIVQYGGKIDDSNFIVTSSSKQQSSQTGASKKSKGTASSSNISVVPAGHVFGQLPFTTLCEISYCSACGHLLWGKPCYLLVCSRCKLKYHYWCYAVSIQNPSSLSYCLPSDEQGIKNFSNPHLPSHSASCGVSSAGGGHQRAQSAVIKSESSRRSFFFPDPSKIFKSNQAKSASNFFPSDSYAFNRVSHENLTTTPFACSSSESSSYSSSSSSADTESDDDINDDDYVSASSDPSTPSLKVRNRRIKKTKRSKSLEEGVISSSVNSCPTDSDSLVDVNITAKSKEYEQVNEEEAKERQLVRDKIRRKLKQRKMNTLEFIATEKSFGRKLLLLHDLFYLPIVNASTLLTPHEINILFSNHLDLIKLHVELYGALKKLKPLLRHKRNQINWTQIGQDIEAIFLRLAPMLERDLALFCSNFIPANELLKTKTKSSKFSMLLSEAESTSALNKLKLTDLLAAPFQRIMRYPLLVTEICNTFGTLSESSNSKFAKREAEARVAFDSALRVIKNIVQGVNQRKSKYEFLSWFKGKIAPFYPKNNELTIESLQLKAEGQVTWRFNKEKSFPGHLLILPDLLLILTQESPINQLGSSSNLSSTGSTTSVSTLLPSNSSGASVSSTSPSIVPSSIASATATSFSFSFLSEQLQAAEASGATYVLKDSPVDANDKNPLTHTTIPVLEVTTDVSTRDHASNMTAFFLFSKGASKGEQKSGPSAAMYELSTNSPAERKALTDCINKLVECKRFAGQPSITHPSTNPFLTNYQEQHLQQQQLNASVASSSHSNDPAHSIRNRPLPPLPTSASLQAVANIASTSTDSAAAAQRHSSSHPSSLMRRSRSQDPGDRNITIVDQNVSTGGTVNNTAVSSSATSVTSTSTSTPSSSNTICNNSPPSNGMTGAGNSQSSDLPPIVGLIERVPNREPLASFRESVDSIQPDVRYAQRVGVIHDSTTRDEINIHDHEQQLNLQIYDLLKERQLLLSRKNTSSSANTYTNVDSTTECLGNLTLDAFRYEILLSSNDNDNELIELRAKLINSLSK